jgi:hypothetical protein
MHKTQLIQVQRREDAKLQQQTKRQVYTLRIRGLLSIFWPLECPSARRFPAAKPLVVFSSIRGQMKMEQLKGGVTFIDPI